MQKKAGENQEIDIEALMAEIRARAGFSCEPVFEPLPVAELGHSSPAPDADLAKHMDSALSAVNVAAERAHIEHLPAMRRYVWPIRGFARLAARIVLYLVRFLVHPQIRFNHAVVEAFRSVIGSFAQHTTELTYVLREDMNRQLQARDEKISTLERNILLLESTIGKLQVDTAGIGKNVLRHDNQMVETGEAIALMGERQKDAASKVQEIAIALQHSSQGAERRFDALSGVMESMKVAVKELADANTVESEEVGTLKIQFSSVAGQGEAFTKQLNSLAGQVRKDFEQKAGQLKKIERAVAYLKAAIAMQESESRKAFAASDNAPVSPVSPESVHKLYEANHSLDAVYAALEDQFRGTRDEIKNRLSVYLPRMERVKDITNHPLILDIGCGRGEWLELLRDKGLTGKGVEFNRVFTEACRRLGIDVVEADALIYLRELRTESIAAVTAFHVVEHLSFEYLIALVDEAIRVLQPNGIVIFETPNPDNLLVGSCSFYLDPTHRNPLPSPILKFIAEVRGLVDVEVVFLHPYPDDLRLSGSEVADRLSDLCYGARDYAVIGRKP